MLPHPGFQPCDAHFLSQYCYVNRHHGETGPALVIHRGKDDIYAQFGDWNGNVVGLEDSNHPLYKPSVVILENTFNKLVSLMSTANFDQACYYFSGSGLLVDVRLSLNKFAGPGMTKDIFGKLVDTPEVLKIEMIDERAMDAIRAGSGTYSGDIILRPSKYKEMEIQKGVFVPLWAQVRR